MKTLQQQYQLIKEGKGRKDLFIRQALRQFPNILTKFNTYNEVVTILKGKQVISEGIGGVASIGGITPFSKFSEFLAEEAKVEEKKTTKEVEEKQTKNFDYTDPKNIDNLYGQQFLNGYYVEMKDPKNKDKNVDELKGIVAKNLEKDRNFYVKNAAFGIKGIGYTDEAPGLKASKSDQMEKVKMNEGRVKLMDLLNEWETVVREQEDEKKSKKKKAIKPKKESTDSKLSEIEKQGKIVTLEAQLEALTDIIESKKQRIELVSEDDSLSELVDAKKIKELQKEIKLLEKKKANMEKMYEKMAGKSYKAPITDGEDLSINPEADEISPEDLDAASDYYDKLS